MAKPCTSERNDDTHSVTSFAKVIGHGQTTLVNKSLVATRDVISRVAQAKQFACSLDDVTVLASVMSTVANVQQRQHLTDSRFVLNNI